MAQIEGHARAHSDRQLDVQDVFGDRLARRLLHRAAGDHQRDSQGSRLSDRRRGGAVASRRRLCAVACRLNTTIDCRAEYRARRDLLLPVLEKAGFQNFRPDGAYYIMTDISALVSLTMSSSRVT